MLLRTALVLSALTGSPAASTGAVAVAQESPAPAAEDEGTWINHFGAPPTPRSFEGRAVVLMFFGGGGRGGGSGGRGGVNWGQIRAQVNEWDGKVTFLGVFSGSADAAQRFADDNNLFFPIGVDTPLRDHFAVRDASHQMLLDRDGAVFWSGPLSGLWEGKLEKGARGATNAFEERALFVHPRREYDGRLGRIADELRDGELQKAHRKITQVLEDDHADAAEQAGATELLELMERHVERLQEQLERELARREALRVVETLEVVEKELRKTPWGAHFSQRLEELEDDEEFQRELDADRDFADIYDAYWTRPPSKWVKKIAYFLEEHEGTRAAGKARVLAQG